MIKETAKQELSYNYAIKSSPHSIEAEQHVLGGLLLDNQSWEQIAELLQTQDFYKTEHQYIFQSIEQLAVENRPFDPLTISDILESQDKLQKSGGIDYLTELALNTPSIHNIKYYAEIIRERAILRKLIGVSKQITNICHNPDGRNSNAVIEESERLITKISEDNQNLVNNEIENIHEVLQKTIKKIDELNKSGKQITGCSTGFCDFDAMTSGLQQSDLVILAARPSMGKTTLAMNIAENAVINSSKPVLVFSLEMPKEQLTMRMLSSLGRINQSRLRTGQLHDEDWPKLLSAVERLKDKKLFIDDSSSLSPISMRSKIKQLVRTQGELGLIVIDYLQLMQIPGFSEGRTNEISSISRSLKAIAKDFNVPVIALSQLNRSLEQRPNKRPINSDLRESGAIEQDADLILFIYRDEVYNPESEQKGIAEIIIGKHRNGPIGSVRLAFFSEYTRFENLAAETYTNK
jgi:replicative DNA helicase